MDDSSGSSSVTSCVVSGWFEMIESFNVSTSTLESVVDCEAPIDNDNDQKFKSFYLSFKKLCISVDELLFSISPVRIAFL